MAESCEVLHSFSCSICLDVLKNPVTLHCGHSYCMDCINGCFDQEDQSGIYSCPQCRHTFNPRPVLKKNTVLVDLMVKMSVRAQSNMRVKDEVGPGDVECDFCTVRKLKAAKSCLVCLASYCATHLQPHYKSAQVGRSVSFHTREDLLQARQATRSLLSQWWAVRLSPLCDGRT